MKRALMVCCLLGLCACASQRQPERPPSPPEQFEPVAADPDKVRQLRGDVIGGLLDKGQYYAALAYIEEQKKRSGESVELTLLEAEARRHLRQNAQAEALYRKLIGGPLEGQAYHGLGLMYVSTDIDAAIRNLKSAAQRLPTDVDVRSDYGYALMEAGRYAEALPELSTAAELAPAQLKSRNNLIILMMLTGNQAGLAQLSQQSGTTPETLRQLRAQAQTIRSQQKARAARAPA